MKKNNRTEQEYREAAKKSFSIAGMCRELGLGAFGASYRRIHKAIEMYNIDISHFTGSAWNIGMAFNPSNYRKKDLSEILVEKSTYDSTNSLKLRLFNEGIKEHKCERCGRTEWEGEEIPLQLHHINGVRNDNRIENLQILCSNCHALTDNYCGKNISRKTEKKRTTLKEKYEKVKEVYGEDVSKQLYGDMDEITGKKKEKEKRYCEICGKEINNHKNKYCSKECFYKSNKKTPYDDVIADYVSQGKSNLEIAEMYGVTEACIRKRRKKLNI